MMGGARYPPLLILHGGTSKFWKLGGFYLSREPSSLTINGLVMGIVDAKKHPYKVI